ncbi:lantibiotic dehydratase C-terminal domain-containing protein [Arthrobacter caoxuetaonis]|uniref:lantibiotic dehydratase C-terminal domain-containing protein n=1 Tax=Arthrobacter caoxuetaonis TaxID=2886935 RepID=UPI001E44D996|nr:hypothetical protein NF551_15380 [Arthrobacter caoxuetaonis]
MIWSVLTIEPKRDDVGDEIIRRVVAPLTSQRAAEDGRLAFTRNLDSGHPSVVLYLNATDSGVGRLAKLAQALADENVDKLGEVNISRSPNIVFPVAPGDPIALATEVFLARFGGPKGVELLQENTRVSSDLTLWAINRFPTLKTRSMLAALLLFDTAHAMMRGPRSALWPDRRAISWDYYWNTHLHTCTGSLGSSPESVRTAMAQIAPRVMPTHRVMAAVASEPAVDIWRKRWVRAIDEYLYRADKNRISRSAPQLAMVAGHLTLNRLGFPSRDQGALGLYARAWSKEIEAKYLGEERSRTR